MCRSSRCVQMQYIRVKLCVVFRVYRRKLSFENVSLLTSVAHTAATAIRSLHVCFDAERAVQSDRPLTWATPTQKCLPPPVGSLHCCCSLSVRIYLFQVDLDERLQSPNVCLSRTTPSFSHDELEKPKYMHERNVRGPWLRAPASEVVS